MAAVLPRRREYGCRSWATEEDLVDCDDAPAECDADEDGGLVDRRCAEVEGVTLWPGSALVSGCYNMPNWAEPMALPRRQGTAGGWDRLSPQQQRTVVWMEEQCRRRASGAPAGGLLPADTIQGPRTAMLTFLDAALRSGRHQGPALVITDPGAVHEWRREAAERTPNLNVVLLTSSDHEALRGPIVASLHGNPVLLLSTRGMLRSCAQLLGTVAFHFTVLEDAEWLRRPSGTTARAALQLRCGGVRVVVTADPPSEERPEDLGAMMGFVDHAILGASAAEMREAAAAIRKGLRHGAHADRRQHAQQVCGELRRRCAPHICGAAAVQVMPQYQDALRDLTNTPPPAGRRGKRNSLASLCEKVGALHVSETPRAPYQEEEPAGDGEEQAEGEEVMEEEEEEGEDHVDGREVPDGVSQAEDGEEGGDEDDAESCGETDADPLTATVPLQGYSGVGQCTPAPASTPFGALYAPAGATPTPFLHRAHCRGAPPTPLAPFPLPDSSPGCPSYVTPSPHPGGAGHCGPDSAQCGPPARQRRSVQEGTALRFSTHSDADAPPAPHRRLFGSGSTVRGGRGGHSITPSPCPAGPTPRAPRPPRGPEGAAHGGGAPPAVCRELSYTSYMSAQRSSVATCRTAAQEDWVLPSRASDGAHSADLGEAGDAAAHWGPEAPPCYHASLTPVPHGFLRPFATPSPPCF
eukprot:TRINITY_DN55271_c0_g1_i1.p1 TRINITY_DN55271_c0_g1~~TRINITY_DN55271_c0_g1_i1.p1  ORF type:complete len:720 (+),score=160.81 TRINITY_DN55271_c0_g1_i1:81-2162(+)